MNFGISPKLYLSQKSIDLLNSIQNTSLDILSIEELVSALKQGDRTTYSEIIHNFYIPNADFEDYGYWSDEIYTRNCIFENDQFELILLCWNPNQITPIHDHGGEECWVRVIKGEFEEVIYSINKQEELREVKTHTAKENEVTYMIDFMGFHTLQNLTNERGMTLHLYAKPIRSCNSYDLHEGKLIHRELVYTTMAESA